MAEVKIEEWALDAAREIHSAHNTTLQQDAAIIARAYAESGQGRLLNRAMIVLKGLNIAVEWELAPEIKKEIAAICKEFQGVTQFGVRAG